MRRPAIAFAVLSLIGITSLHASAFSRTEDHLIIKGKKFKELKDAPIDKIRIYTIKKGSPEIVPFQIDKLNVDGDYIFNFDDEKSRVKKRKEAYEDAMDDNGMPPEKLAELKRSAEWIENKEVFDEDDELVFMSRELGERAGGNLFAKAKSVEEIKIKNPADSSSGYAYAVLFENDAPKLSGKTYVSYNPETDEVYADQYVLKTNKERPFSFREAMPRFADGRIAENQIDYSGTSIALDVKFFPTLHFDEKNIKAKITAYKTGPVRAIKRMLCWMQVAFVRVTPKFTMDMIFYPNGIIAPGVIECPFIPKRILNPGSTITIGQDFKECMTGAKIYTDRWTKMAVLDGKMSDEEKSLDMKNHKWYVVYTQNDGSIFIQIAWDKILPDIKTDIVYIDDKNVVTKGEQSPGKHTAGFSSDILQFPKGRYMMYINVYLDRKWWPGREKYYLDILANPLVAEISSIK